ncbi:Brix-domain-containing protein [Histomonas meleagridis]|uniref:Brix-domain-containing protein n=1 Tax=Histomonas meleagridis TaxID=135588 RepID=UPI003559BB6C|nr:Brix-domain-containing protein [Histomonas meleagridis]KAH0798673.1 Brix-domain-containing protein [Histomonas meleagridis]
MFGPSDYSSSEEEPPKPHQNIPPPKAPPVKQIINYQPLVVAKRGISSELRIFMKDFLKLLPGAQREKKFKGNHLVTLNDLADAHNCNSIIVFETRHSNENYIWFSLSPGGPTVCFYLQNIHTTEELHLIGICSDQTRPLIFFDPAFDSDPFYGVTKQLFTRIFSVPYSSSKIVVDTAISFHIADDRIWLSRYQISWNGDNVTLFEAGPRCCMYHVLALSGSFCGRQIHRNAKFIPPHKLKKIVEIERMKRNIVKKPVIDPESDAKMKIAIENKLETKKIKDAKREKRRQQRENKENE